MEKLSKEEYKKIITDKGWSLTDVAVRWGYKSSVRVHQIANSKDRPIRYDDMVKGLPYREI
ncbi:hypothetical protein OAA_13975 [Vibrio cyclitrophicus 1F175]|uniref:hypothetical protein n=1 Tax=Vibrio cyclitrophicus TaxID=47951 RepID=UPI00037702DD|nr:hypothetical protein [Vibrio cyclitrophicus]OEF63588.1 hypothetical protein OAA_13975 [Vibrio cyclitrophicus 1F175]